MNYQIFEPDKSLKEYVRFYWTLEGHVSPDQPYIHRTLANASPELIFHYRGPFEELTLADQAEKTFLTGIHAQTNRVRRFSAKSDFGIFGVYLQPFAIPALFGISSLDIKNELPDLEIILGQQGRDLTEKVLSAEDNNHRLRIIDHFLKQRLTRLKRPEIAFATRYVFQRNGQVNIGNLARKACLSQRQFERKFKEYVGFTPKTFSRIVRFNSLLWKFKHENKSLTEIAYEYGYYDQSHFIHDFKQFSGYNPKTYFSGNADEVFYAP